MMSVQSHRAFYYDGRGAVTVIMLALLLTCLPEYLKIVPDIPSPQGHVKPGWEAVQHAFNSNFDKKWDKGSAFAVYHKGELVVNLWGGFANQIVEQPWKHDTITKIYSSAKGIAACVLAMLVERGHIKYEENVSTYWPEFTEHNKENITVEQLLSQQAGLFMLSEQYTEFDTLYNWNKIKNIMEKQKPHWTPGDGHGYHMLTFGLFIDQLVRLTDPEHRSVAKFFEEEIAKPFDIDFSFGLKREDNFRCAFSSVSVDYTHLNGHIPIFKIFWTYLTDSQSYIRKLCPSIKEMLSYKHERVNNPDYRLIQNPSSSGYGTAEGVAKFYGILANGGHYGDKKILLPKTLTILQEALTSGEDKVYLMNVTYGRGTILLPSPLGSIIFGTPGFGGQMAYADTKYNLGWAYITNYANPVAFSDDKRYLAVQDAMYQVVKDTL